MLSQREVGGDDVGGDDVGSNNTTASGRESPGLTVQDNPHRQPWIIERIRIKREREDLITCRGLDNTIFVCAFYRTLDHCTGTYEQRTQTWKELEKY